MAAKVLGMGAIFTRAMPGWSLSKAQQENED